MKAFQLTKEQIAKLRDLVKAISPSYKLQATSYDGSFLWGHKSFTWWYVSDGEREIMGWLEYCLLVAAPFIAEEYSKHHMDCTRNWATRLVSQHLINDIQNHNPIDTLYDIWKNPNKYVQDIY